MMTTRDRFNRQKRWVMGTVYAGMGVFFAAVLGRAALGQPPLQEIYIPAFGVAGVAMVIGMLFAFKCPNCDAGLSSLTMHGGLSVDSRLNFCPYCGQRLDEELPDQQLTGAKRHG